MVDKKYIIYLNNNIKIVNNFTALSFCSWPPKMARNRANDTKRGPKKGADSTFPPSYLVCIKSRLRSFHPWYFFHDTSCFLFSGESVTFPQFNPFFPLSLHKNHLKRLRKYAGMPCPLGRGALLTLPLGRKVYEKETNSYRNRACGFSIALVSDFNLSGLAVVQESQLLACFLDHAFEQIRIWFFGLVAFDCNPHS